MKLTAKHTFSELFSSLFDARILLLFILGSLAFGVAGNTAYDIVLAYSGEPARWELWLILVASIGVLFAVTSLIQLAVRIRLRNSMPDGSEAFNVPRKGVSILSENPKTSCLHPTNDRDQHTWVFSAQRNPKTAP